MTYTGVKRVAAVLVGIATLSVCLMAHADAPRVLITELQTGSVENGQPNASHEFVELTNITDQTVDITNWQLDYRAASGSSWSTKATLSGQLYPGGSIVVASDGYLVDIANFHMPGGVLASSGGQVRLMPTDNSNAEDTVGWGTAQWPETKATAVPAAGQSLQRLLTDGHFVDTNNNFNDFLVGVPEPRNDNAEPELPLPTPTPEPIVIAAADPSPTPTPDTTPTPEPTASPTPTSTDLTADLLPPVINELLPDPAAPLVDAKDEWIELYNPNDQALPLAGWRLQTGGTFSYSHLFDQEIIEPHGYLVLYSANSHLVLSNSGGAVRMIDSDGQVIAGPVTYSDVETGQSYALADGTWQWTTTPTPGAENDITWPLPAVLATSAKTLGSKTKSTATTKSAAAKSSTAKAAKTTTKTTKVSSATDRKVVEQPATIDTPPGLHPLVLAVVGSLALLYAGYEYREDLVHRLAQCRRYLAYRREHRR